MLLFSMPFYRQLKKGLPYFLLLLTAFFLPLFFSVLLSQECDTEKALKEKTEEAKKAAERATKAEQAFNNLPALGPKPANGNNEEEAKKSREEAKTNWDKAKKDLEGAKKKLPDGSDDISLKQELENKKNDLASKKEEYAKKDLTSYIKNANEITKLEADFNKHMEGFNRNSAREVLKNNDYNAFNPSNTKAIEDCAEEIRRKNNASEDMNFKPECYSNMAENLLKFNTFKSEEITKLRKELQEAVTASNATVKVASVSDEAPWKTISRAGPQLIKEMDKIRTDLRAKYTELVKLEDGIGILAEEIKALQGEIQTIENQLKPITEAEKVKKKYEEAEKKFEQAEKNAKALKEWNRADENQKKVEKEKKEAQEAKTLTEKEKTDAENAHKKFKEDAEKAYQNAINEIKKIKEEYSKDKAALPNPANLEAIKAMKDKAAQAFRHVQSSINPYNCVEKKFRDLDKKLGTVITRLGGAGASLVSDMDNPFAALREIPSIDIFDDNTPTDEVPDDITKNTGEVKVIRYFVFLLTNSSNGLYVGSEESLKGRTRCSFIGGGINCKPVDVITYKKLLGPFASQAEAFDALCKSITESRIFPLAVGLKGRWQGSNNWYGLWESSVIGCPPK